MSNSPRIPKRKKIPKGVQRRQLVILRGRGLLRCGFLVDYGDQYVQFWIISSSSLPTSMWLLLSLQESNHEEYLMHLYANGPIIVQLNPSKVQWRSIRFAYVGNHKGKKDAKLWEDGNLMCERPVE